MKPAVDRIRWLGQAGFLIEDRLTVYIDPVQVPPGLPRADVVLLTHSHDSHCSQKDVEALAGPSTIVAGAKDSVSRFRLNQMPMKPGDSREILGLKVRAVDSYQDKPDTVHPRRHNWVGFVIELEGGVVYHPGDSDAVPEMAALRADVVLWPLVGRDFASLEVGCRSLKALEPKFVFPMHYDPATDAAVLERFRELCRPMPWELRLS